MYSTRMGSKSRVFPDSGYHDLETERRTICCCDTKMWTFAIGVGQMLASTSIITYSSSYLFYYEDEELSYEERIVHGGTTIAINVVSLIMGIFLVLGAYKESSRCLLIWLIFNMLATLFFVANEISKFIDASYAHSHLLLLLLKILVHVSIQQFFMWVVNTFRKELNLHRRSSNNNNNNNPPEPSVSLYSLDEAGRDPVVPVQSSGTKVPASTGEAVASFILKDMSGPSHFV